MWQTYRFLVVWPGDYFVQQLNRIYIDASGVCVAPPAPTGGWERGGDGVVVGVVAFHSPASWLSLFGRGAYREIGCLPVFASVCAMAVAVVMVVGDGTGDGQADSQTAFFWR